MSARESHAIKVCSNYRYSRRSRVRCPTDRKIGVQGGAQTGQVSQVAYLDPAGFITWENGSDMRDATTYKFNMFYGELDELA